MGAKVFVSYARKDDELVEELVGHLNVLRRLGQIDIWYDRKLEPGADWKVEIESQMESADIILLLVSKDFINSDYCDYEMKRALELRERKKTCVISVLMKPVASWKKFPFAQFQIYPTDALPVSSWESMDDAFMSVMDGVTRAAEKIASERSETYRGARSGSHPIPEDLLYMCDRGPQETAIDLTLEGAVDPSRPFVFVIHGHDDEEPVAFRRRLEKSTLPKLIFGGPHLGSVTSVRPEWPQSPADEAGFARSYWKQLAFALTDNYLADQAAIVRNVVDRASPLLVSCEIRVDSWNDTGRGRLDGLLSFWNDFPDLPARRRHIICCPIISYGPREGAAAAAADARDLFRKMERGAPPYVTLAGRTLERVNVRVLPELPSIGAVDVESWIQNARLFKGLCPRSEHDDTFCGVLEALNEIQGKIYAARREIPMRQLVPQLRSLVDNHRCKP